MKNHFLDRYSHLESPIHSLDARVKVIAFVSCLVICVTTPTGAYHAFLGYFLCLLILAVLSRIPLAYIVKRSLVVVPFVLLIALFLPFKGGEALDGADPTGHRPADYIQVRAHPVLHCANQGVYICAFNNPSFLHNLLSQAPRGVGTAQVPACPRHDYRFYLSLRLRYCRRSIPNEEGQGFPRLWRKVDLEFPGLSGK